MHPSPLKPPPRPGTRSNTPKPPHGTPLAPLLLSSTHGRPKQLPTEARRQPSSTSVASFQCGRPTRLRNPRLRRGFTLDALQGMTTDKPGLGCAPGWSRKFQAQLTQIARQSTRRFFTKSIRKHVRLWSASIPNPLLSSGRLQPGLAGCFRDFAKSFSVFFAPGYPFLWKKMITA